MKRLLVMLAAGAAAWGQSNGSLRARELFYTPPPDASAAKQATSAPATPVASNAAPSQTKAAPKTVARKAPAKNAGGQVAASNTSPASAPSRPAASSGAPSAVPVQNVALQSSTAIPLGLRYAILKRNAAGQYQEVDVDSTFHSGDRIRIEVQANQTAHLYVVAQGSSGAWQVLFPSREISGGSNVVRRGDTRVVPGGNAGQFVFDEQAGTEKLFLVLSREPETDIEKLIYSVGGQGAPADSNTARPGAAPERVLLAKAMIGDDVISRIRGQMQARDLIFEKVENEKVEPSAGGAGASQPRLETAAYVVNPSTAPDARLVVDLKLKHE
jgi:hypothetical protein